MIHQYLKETLVIIQPYNSQLQEAVTYLQLPQLIGQPQETPLQKTLTM
jgi:hypothetical protein